MKHYKIYLIAVAAGILTGLFSWCISGSSYEFGLWWGWIMVIGLSGMFLKEKTKSKQ